MSTNQQFPRESSPLGDVPPGIYLLCNNGNPDMVPAFLAGCRLPPTADYFRNWKTEQLYRACDFRYNTEQDRRDVCAVALLFGKDLEQEAVLIGPLPIEEAGPVSWSKSQEGFFIYLQQAGFLPAGGWPHTRIVGPDS